EPRGDDRDAQAGLHRQRARAGDLRRPHRWALRAEERDGPDTRDDRTPLRLDAGRHGAGRDRLRLAGDRPLRGELGRVERLPADHGGDAPARPQLPAPVLPRRPRVRLARPADARGGRRVMDQALARAPLLAWLERHAPTVRELRRDARIFARSASSLLGLALVLAFLLVAAAGPFIVPYPEDARGAVHLDRKLQAPSAAHWFGTDEVGNDIYTRVILGARLSLWIGLLITLVGGLIGVPFGIVAGYVGGVVGDAIMRVTDVFLSVPALVLALAIVGALGPGIMNAIVALSLVWWPGYVRLVQGKTLSVKTQTFVEAARAVGTGRLRVVFVHILPNCLSPITVKASMDMGTAILAAAGLGFIGLGAQPPYPEWGAMISHGRNYLPTWWWYSAFPGLFIHLTVLGFNLLGDGLRDVLDPKSRGAGSDTAELGENAGDGEVRDERRRARRRLELVARLLPEAHAVQDDEPRPGGAQRVGGARDGGGI